SFATLLSLFRSLLSPSLAVARRCPPRPPLPLPPKRRPLLPRPPLPRPPLLTRPPLTPLPLRPTPLPRPLRLPTPLPSNSGALQEAGAFASAFRFLWPGTSIFGRSAFSQARFWRAFCLFGGHQWADLGSPREPESAKRCPHPQPEAHEPGLEPERARARP